MIEINKVDSALITQIEDCLEYRNCLIGILLYLFKDNQTLFIRF